MKKNKCDNCGQFQLGFSELINYTSKKLCSHCYNSLFDGILYDIIKMEIPHTDEIIYLPLKKNLEKEIEENDQITDVKSLIKIWSEIKWGYIEKFNISVISKKLMIEEAVDEDDFDEEIIECTEFDIFCFKSLSIKSYLYSQPWDEEPEDNYYSSYFAIDCMVGQIYNKDFTYSKCDWCEKNICEQNPFNGWVTQFRDVNNNEERICLKCLQESILVMGIPEESFEQNKIPSEAMFYSHSELKEFNWELYKSDIRIQTIDDTENMNQICLKLLNKEKKVLLDLSSMSIGGLEGYLNIYIKNNKN